MTTTKPDFIYVTYIRTTPDAVWQAITDPSVCARYWIGLSATGTARVNVSDWKRGSRWEHQRTDGTATVDIAGTVLEVERPKRLVISWGRPAELDDPTKLSRVTLEISKHSDELVKLTVLHEDVARDEKMFGGISGGWPMILSNLKTMLESGSVLPQPKA